MLYLWESATDADGIATSNPADAEQGCNVNLKQECRSQIKMLLSRVLETPDYLEW